MNYNISALLSGVAKPSMRKPKYTLPDVVKGMAELYSPLTEECQAEVSTVMQLKTAPKGTVLIREGDAAEIMHFVVQGGLRAYYLKDGKDITDWFSFEGEYLTSMNSFFEGQPSVYYIETTEATTYATIGKDEVYRLAEKYHCWETLFRKATTHVLLQFQERIVSLQFETAQQRYENLLKVRPNILQRVSLTHIASYLGITLETLSRIRNPRYGVSG